MTFDINSLVEIKLFKDDDFLKIKETLSRIGVASKKENVLYQSCHILHKQGHYYIVHFKELFSLDGKPSSISEADIARRNTIVSLLSDWGLLKICKPEQIEAPIAPISQVKVLSFNEKNDWELVTKYNIGKKK